MQVAISPEVEAIIDRQVSSGKFASREAAVEASVRFFDISGAAAIDRSRGQLRRELRVALEESRNGDSHVTDPSEFLLEARRIKKLRNLD